MTKNRLQRRDIERLLAEMGRQTAATGRCIDFYVGGGAAWMLSTDYHPIASDIDYMVIPDDDYDFLGAIEDKIGPSIGIHRTGEALFHTEIGSYIDEFVKSPNTYFDFFGPSGYQNGNGLKVFLLKGEPQFVLKTLRWFSEPDQSEISDLGHYCYRQKIASVEEWRAILPQYRACLPQKHV